MNKKKFGIRIFVSQEESLKEIYENFNMSNVIELALNDFFKGDLIWKFVYKKEESRNVSVTLPKDQIEILRKYSAEKGIPMNQIIYKALEKFIEGAQK